MTDLVELRGEIPREYIDVIDAVVQATPGANRMTVVREILADWVEREVHRATVILAVRRGKGSDSAAERRG